MLERRVLAGGPVHHARLHGTASRLILLALTTLTLLVFVDFPAEAAPAVGAIAGSFAATPTGGATYAIPLPAPGGAGGLAPRLSLVYASGSGPGLLGWDATVGGLSIITRCPSAWPYDGSTAPVNLTARDRFCLDGQELTFKSGTYGDNGAVYVTTPTAHMRVTSYTSNNATGPQWFKVLHPNGSVWEYGHQFSSEVSAANASGQSVGRVWALDRITDASGNTMTFHYTQPSGTGPYYLSTVDWGANSSAGTSADHSLAFSYVTVSADATVYRYVVGHKIAWNRRISKIALEYNGVTTLTWTPRYLANGQGSDRSRLASVSECDAAGACLPATTFQWQPGSPGYGTPTNTGQATTTSGYAFVEDVNGDGREDLVYDRGGVWRVRFGLAGGGFGAEHSSGVAVLNAGYAQPIHYQPGAGDEVLVDDGGDWAILAWTGSAFNVIHTGIAATGAAVAADVNGDGYDDLVTYSGGSLLVRLNTTLTGSGPGFGAAQTAYTLPSDTFVGFRGVGADGARGPERALHFTRTTEAGLIARVKHDEVICLTDGCTRKHIITSYHDRAFVWTNGTLAPYGPSFASGLAGAAAGGAVVALDVNGDGLSDLVPSGTATLLLNTGNGFSSVAYGSSTSGLTLSAAVAVDYSGNGRDDLLVPSTITGEWMELASTGTGFAAPTDTGIASGAFGTQSEVADTAGRMLSDLVGVNGAGDLELALRHGPYPDLLTKITDGFGNYHNLTWVPLSNGIVTATLAVNKNFELARRGRYLLASVQRNNGIGGSYTVSDHYDTPLTQAGAGFAGIRRITASDSRSGDTTTRVFTINKYDSGNLSSVTLAQANGSNIREDTYIWLPPQRGEPLELKNWTTTRYDPTGSAMDTVARVYRYDSLYILDDTTVTRSDAASGQQWITETVRTNDDQSATPSDWCLNLVSAVTVSDTLPSGASASRETTYTPDLAHCRVSGVTTNAGAATHLRTATTLTYDAFGHIATLKVVGHQPDGTAMAARTTHYGYDSHGEFRTAVTDAAGDVAHAVWNGALGVETSRTAANGRVTTYNHDGFGRLTKTALPTGASATVDYQACSGSSCSHWAYSTLTQASAAGGSAAGRAYRYYDRYGRRVEQAVERLGGRLAYAYTSRNARGQITREAPPSYSGNSAYWTRYTYDALGRVTKITAPASVSNPGGQVTRYAYSGLTTTITLPDGATRTVRKNLLGQVVSVTDAAGNTSTYTYAPFAELTQVKGVDQASTNLTYDAAGHRTQLSGPDRGTLKFSVDSLGEVTQEINARNQAITLGYDRLGRMTQRCFPSACGTSGTEIQHWIYATSGNGAGRLATESDNTTGFSRTVGGYNALGEPTSIEETYNGIPQTLALGYDSLGRMTSITYPVSVGGHPLTVDYAYGSSGHLDKVSNANTGTVYWQPESGVNFPVMNALGQMQATTLGGALDVERLHDAATGAVTSITSGPNGSGSVLNLTTSYNASGSRLSLNDLNAGLNESYQYDSFQRLTGVTRTAAGGNSSSGFTYDKAGQFTQGPAGTYAYGAFPKHSPSSTTENGITTAYSYDTAGDRTRARLPQVTWNALGQAHTIQTGTATIHLTYGPDGGLVNNSGVDGGRYLGAFLKQTDTNDWSARIIVQGRVIAVVKDSGGSISTAYLLQGPLGSTAAVATGGGSLTRRITYGVWGRLVHPDTGTGSVNPTTIGAYTTVTYTGHELIAGAGLINMGARLYDPATGLFMSPDPIVAYLYNSQDLNQYAYVNDNPLSYVDPSGFNPSCASDPPGPCDLPQISAIPPPCDLSCIGGMMDDGMLQLYLTGGRGLGMGGGGGGGSGTTAHSKQAKKKQCNKNLVGAPPSGNSATPSSTGSNGWGDFSRLYNPNLQRNIGYGVAAGGAIGFAGTVVVLVSVVGFPVAEMAELGTLGFLGGAVLAVPFGAIGYFSTPPKSSPTPPRQCQ